MHLPGACTVQMYEQAQPVRTPVTGSDRRQNSGPSVQVPPNHRDNTSDPGNHSGMHGDGPEASSNLYEEAEAVNLKKLSGDEPYGTETSTGNLSLLGFLSPTLTILEHVRG